MDGGDQSEDHCDAGEPGSRENPCEGEEDGGGSGSNVKDPGRIPGSQRRAGRNPARAQHHGPGEAA
eukprot:526092-Rhodomonas_salina.1